ncbi:phosphopantetheine-binding protein [Lentzea sp. NPDC058436]|uniref:phosphopantetheine-binding protein n=1 Tax=Lentzea sp. NPDC058436 TaxID=3346499 RepID=UPI00364AAE6D
MTTTDRLRGQVAALLEIPPGDIGDDDNLLDHGLDSMRLMALADVLRGEGSSVSFMELMEEPTVSSWSRLLAG